MTLKVNLLYVYLGGKMFDCRFTMRYIVTRGRNAKQVVIFGASKLGIDAYSNFNKEKIVVDAFCDNNRSIQGTNINNVKVTSPEQAVMEYPDALYVVASANHRDEIIKQLMKLHISKEHIVSYYELQSSYEFYKALNVKDYEEAVLDFYYRRYGKYLSLHPPKTYNEKIIWQKLYGSNEIKTRLTDKYLVRDWVEHKIGKKYLNDLIGCWKNADEIDFSVLPEQFVLKMNHGCGWNIIVRDKKKINKKEICTKLEEWKELNFAYQSLEMQYKNIVPMILCEKYLENAEEDLWDYKVFCFHGEPKYIMFLSERNLGGLKMAFYNMNWERQPFVYSYPRLKTDIPRPSCLDTLLDLSSELAKDFDHVRVDWYILPDGNIRFGEMTFTPAAGYAVWDPPVYDKVLGDLI